MGIQFVAGFYRGIIILGFLWWCRISSTHSTSKETSRKLSRERNPWVQNMLTHIQDYFTSNCIFSIPYSSMGKMVLSAGEPNHMAVGQNQWYHFGVGAPPILEPIFSGDWDVHWGVTRLLTHGHIMLMSHSKGSHCRRCANQTSHFP